MREPVMRAGAVRRERFYRESAGPLPRAFSPAVWPLQISSTDVLFRRGIAAAWRWEAAHSKLTTFCR